MKTGDLVTATPSEIEVSKEDTTPDSVTGRLEITPVDFMGEKYNLYLVYVKDKDGDNVPVEVSEESIKPAGRREKVTVL